MSCGGGRAGWGWWCGWRAGRNGGHGSRKRSGAGRGAGQCREGGCRGPVGQGRPGWALPEAAAAEGASARWHAGGRPCVARPAHTPLACWPGKPEQRMPVLCPWVRSSEPAASQPSRFPRHLCTVPPPPLPQPSPVPHLSLDVHVGISCVCACGVPPHHILLREGLLVCSQQECRHTSRGSAGAGHGLLPPTCDGVAERGPPHRGPSASSPAPAPTLLHLLQQEGVVYVDGAALQVAHLKGVGDVDGAPRLAAQQAPHHPELLARPAARIGPGARVVV